MTAGSGESVTPLEHFPIPYNKGVELFHVVYENGFPILRLRIREGKRFTTLDLDAPSAAHWGDALLKWAKVHAEGEGAE